MKQLLNDIHNFVDDKGNLIGNIQERRKSIDAAENLTKSLLGATLEVRGNRFIIRMLEIYYGGIGDSAHDWYRTRFVDKTSKFRKQTEAQAKDGFRVYLSSTDVNDTYTRLDLVAGNADVPLSLLVRSVWDSNFNLIGSSNGNPNIVLKAMGIKAIDHDQELSTDPHSSSELKLLDTQEKYYPKSSVAIDQKNRINVKSQFESELNLKWNFYLKEKPTNQHF